MAAHYRSHDRRPSCLQGAGSSRILLLSRRNTYSTVPSREIGVQQQHRWPRLKGQSCITHWHHAGAGVCGHAGATGLLLDGRRRPALALQPPACRHAQRRRRRATSSMTACIQNGYELPGFREGAVALARRRAAEACLRGRHSGGSCGVLGQPFLVYYHRKPAPVSLSLPSAFFFLSRSASVPRGTLPSPFLSYPSPRSVYSPLTPP